MCEEGAPRAGQRQLGHKADPVAAQHPGGVPQPGHAGRLPGRVADPQEQGEEGSPLFVRDGTVEYSMQQYAIALHDYRFTDV